MDVGMTVEERKRYRWEQVLKGLAPKPKKRVRKRKRKARKK